MNHRDPTLLPVTNSKGRFAYYDSTTGELVCEFDYENCSDFSNGTATVSLLGKSFLVNRYIQQVSRPFLNLGNPYDGKAIYYENGVPGIVFEDGSEFQISFADQLGYYSYGHFVYRSGGKWGVINSSLDVVVEPRWKNLRAVKNGFTIGFCDDGTTEIYSLELGSLFRAKVRAVSEVSSDLVVSLQGREVTGKYFGILDLKTLNITQTEFPSIGSFSSGCAPAYSDGRWGYIGTDGSILSQFSYEDATDFSDSTSRVRLPLSSEWRLLDPKFRLLGNRSFKYIEPMISGFSVYAKSQPSSSDKWTFGYVDRNGEICVALGRF